MDKHREKIIRLRKRLELALDMLGESANKVAKNLLLLDSKATATMDPVEVYLIEIIKAEEPVTIKDNTVIVGSDEALRMPVPVVIFRKEFAKGRYKDLAQTIKEDL